MKNTYNPYAKTIKLRIIIFGIPFLAIYLCWCTFVIHSCLAVWAELAEEQMKQAIEYGKTHKDYDNERFLREWTVVFQGTGEKVSLYTKYNSLALSAREAARESRDLRPEEVEAILLKMEGKLVFQAVFYGSTADFADNFHAVLLYEERIIQPIHKETPVTKPYVWAPMATPLFMALCSYEFPLKNINPNGAVTVLFINPKSGEREVNFDLSKMR